MPDRTSALFLIDALTGRLLVERQGQVPDNLEEVLDRLVGRGEVVTCASPRETLSLPTATSHELSSESCLRLAGYWHDSLIEGPGRRSVAKLQGCPLRCSGCAAGDSWDPQGGYLVSVSRLADALLDPAYDRDGVTILGGEPMAQPEGVLALAWALRKRGCPHILVYSGYTYEGLLRMSARRPAIGAILEEVDVLVDGPFVQALAGSGGPWTGSGNQRVIVLAETRRSGRVTCLGGEIARDSSDG